MASNTERTVKVRFDGSNAGLSRAARQAERDLERLRKKADSFNASTAKAAGLVGLVGAVGSLGGPAVAGGIAALGSLGAAGGVVALAFSGVGDAVDEFNKALESGDYTEYEKALARMPKSQADFTRELVKTKQEFAVLKKTAADNTLPGISDALRSTTGLLPILDAGVARTGRIISDTGHDLAQLFRTDEFKSDLDGFLKATEPVTNAIGDSMVKLTGRLVKFGSEMRPASEGFASFLRGLTNGVTGFLDGLAPHAESFKSIWESLGSIVEDILPIAGEFIGELADTWAPVLQDTANWLRENKDEVKEWAGAIAGATPTLLALAAGVKGLSVLKDVNGWVQGALGALKLLGGTNIGGLGKTGGISWGRGFVGGLGLAGIGVGAAIILDDLIPKDAGQSYGVGFARDMLGQMASVFKGEESNVFKQWDVARWIANPLAMGTEMFTRFMNNLLGIASTDIEIGFNANTGPAQDQVAGFMNSLKGKAGTVEINGRTEDASQALAEIIQRINNGDGTVTVNGKTGPASQALQGIIDQINSGAGTVTVNGQTYPAGAALYALLGQVNGSKGTIGVNAATAAAEAAINNAARNRTSVISVVYNGLQRNIDPRFGGGGITRARGGAVFGPGSSTSDSIPAWLSNGEHVLTAREVAAAGGHGAIERLRAALRGGRTQGFATGGAVGTRSFAVPSSLDPVASSMPTQVSSGDVQVRVFLGTTELTEFVRTEVERTNRNTRRLVGSGAGRGF